MLCALGSMITGVTSAFACSCWIKGGYTSDWFGLVDLVGQPRKLSFLFWFSIMAYKCVS